jgi:hypothetical protein
MCSGLEVHHPDRHSGFKEGPLVSIPFSEDKQALGFDIRNLFRYKD